MECLVAAAALGDFLQQPPRLVPHDPDEILGPAPLRIALFFLRTDFFGAVPKLKFGDRVEIIEEESLVNGFQGKEPKLPF